MTRRSYKPDRTDRILFRVMVVFLSITLGGALLMMTVMRFSDPSMALFSIPNIIRGTGALLFLACIGLLFTWPRKPR